jgi:hypothetical protein
MFMSPACADRSTSILSAALTIPASAHAAPDAAVEPLGNNAGPGAASAETALEAEEGEVDVGVAARKAYAAAWNERVASVLKDAGTQMAMEPLLLQATDSASLLSWAAQVSCG